MKALHIFSMVIGLISLISCGMSVKMDYLGQEPPGMTATLFAPGILSTNANEHSAVAFSPDGSVVLWAIMDSQYRGRLFEMRYENGLWSKPASPAFADTTSDDYGPSFSPDGSTLFFSSRRKAPIGYPEGNGNRIWSVAKTQDGWGIPEPLDTIVSKSQEFGHSVASNGTLYFASVTEGSNLDIHKALMNKGHYSKPVMLSNDINGAGYEDGPYIAPDESYLIFESDRPKSIDGSLDLFVVFKDRDGQWGEPVNLGLQVNTGSSERFARVSPDGKYLFFGSDRNSGGEKTGYDFYWIDSKVIDRLR